MASPLQAFAESVKTAPRPSLDVTRLEDGFYTMTIESMETKHNDEKGTDTLYIEGQLAEKAKARANRDGKIPTVEVGKYKLTSYVGLSETENRDAEGVNKNLWKVWASIFGETDAEYAKYINALSTDQYTNTLIQASSSGKYLHVSYRYKKGDIVPNVNAILKDEYVSSKITTKK